MFANSMTMCFAIKLKLHNPGHFVFHFHEFFISKRSIKIIYSTIQPLSTFLSRNSSITSILIPSKSANSLIVSTARRNGLDTATLISLSAKYLVTSTLSKIKTIHPVKDNTDTFHHYNLSPVHLRTFED